MPPMNSQITFPSHRGYRFHQGLLASFVANGIQAVNFLGDRFLRKYHLSAGIEELYRHSMNAAFAEKEAFLVTGARAARARYPSGRMPCRLMDSGLDAAHRPGMTKEMRQNNPTGKSIRFFRNHVKPQNQKYSCLRLTQITGTSSSIPSRSEGRWPSSQRGTGMRWTRRCL
jgi:hypothetical protein